MPLEPSANSQQRDSSLDFLDGPAKAEPSLAEREFAQLYVECFVHNHAGAAILAQWEKAIFWKPTPVNASIQQYVHDEARRQFVRGIRGEIEKVQQARSAM